MATPYYAKELAINTTEGTTTAVYMEAKWCDGVSFKLHASTSITQVTIYVTFDDGDTWDLLYDDSNTVITPLTVAAGRTYNVPVDYNQHLGLKFVATAGSVRGSGLTDLIVIGKAMSR